jgi:hypothetical protein
MSAFCNKTMNLKDLRSVRLSFLCKEACILNLPWLRTFAVTLQIGSYPELSLERWNSRRLLASISSLDILKLIAKAWDVVVNVYFLWFAAFSDVICIVCDLPV